MNRSNSMVKLFSVGMVVCLSFCAKDEMPVAPLEKIPVTTSSNIALREFEQGMTFANKLQRVQAAAHFRKALEVDPGFATAWLNLGFVSSGTAAFITALDSAKYYSTGVSEGEKLLILSAQYGFEGNTSKQEEILLKLVEMYPGDEFAHLTLGNHYFGLQQYQKAILSYHKATSLNNDMAILHNQLGYSQRALGNYGEAEKAFKYYTKLNAENPNAYDSYAELLMEMGRFNESIEFYTTALELDPHFVASHIGIACNYAFLGESEKARAQLAILKQSARSYTESRMAGFSEAMTYICDGDLVAASEAIAANYRLSEQVQDEGAMINDMVILGNIYLEMGRPDEALSRYLKSMELVDATDLPQAVKDNGHTTHLSNIARVYALRGDFQKAKETASQFAKQVQANENPVQLMLVHQLNGIIALQEGEFQAAIDELTLASQMNPYNLFRIGMAYEALGDLEKATSYKQRAAELNVLNSMDQAIVLSKTKFLKAPA